MRMDDWDLEGNDEIGTEGGIGKWELGTGFAAAAVDVDVDAELKVAA